MSKHTENLIKLAVKMSIFDKLKGPRLYEEIILLFKETLPHNSIKRLRDYGLIKVLHPSLEEKDLEKILSKAYETVQAVKLLLLRDFKYEFVYLMSILWTLKDTEREELLKRIYAPEHIKTKLLEELIVAQNALKSLISEDLVEVYFLLKPLSLEVLAVMMIFAKETQRRLISHYLTKLKDIKPQITGHDLEKLGIKPGPIYREIFDAILKEKIRGSLFSKSEEIDFAKKYIS
ncbi:MAG: hypothetical protein ABDH16_02030 [Thermodesulfovibrionaceae bacterium]